MAQAYRDDETLTLRDLWRIFGARRGEARRIIESRGVIVRREPRYYISDEDRGTVISLYLDGATTTAAGAAIGSPSATVLRILKEANIPVRSLSESHRRLFLREDAFADVSQDAEAAYWAGFIMADGAILDKHTLRVKLHRVDREHLVRLRSFLGSEERTISETPEGPYN